MKIQMMKKRNIVSPLFISRRCFYFLIILLLISPMSYAVCTPKEAYNGNTEEESSSSEEVYISEGTTLIITEGTTISGAKFIHTDAPDVKQAKTKLLKREVVKPKVVIKKIVKLSRPRTSTSPTETVSSNDPRQTWSTNGSSSKQISISSNTSIKYFAAVTENGYITVILLFITLLIAVYQRPILNRSLFGCNFQRPPPMFF